MSEQLELRGDSGSTGRRVLIGVIVVVLLSVVAGFMQGFSGGSDSETAVVPGDVASYRTQVITWDTCDSEMFVPVNWFSSGFTKDAALCSSFVVPAFYSPLYGMTLQLTTYNFFLEMPVHFDSLSIIGSGRKEWKFQAKG